MPEGAVPPYLLDREGVSRAKVSLTLGFLAYVGNGYQVLSNTVKQKRKEKAGKWSVPIPKVKIHSPSGTSEKANSVTSFSARSSQ